MTTNTKTEEREMQFRHHIHHRAKEVEYIYHNIKKDGFYFHHGQKRKPESFERKGDYIIITGTIISPI